MTPTPYRARQAREAAGYSATIAARRLGITAKTLLRMEREGFPLYLAQHAAYLYGVHCDERFLGWDRVYTAPGGARRAQVAVTGRNRRLTGSGPRGEMR